MVLSQEYKSAVEQRNALRVKIMLKDSLLVDTTFKQFDAMLQFAESKRMDVWVSDTEDDGKFPEDKSLWDINSLNTELSGLVNRFSHRRVTHLKAMITYLYPERQKSANRTEKQNCNGGLVFGKKERQAYKSIRENRKMINSVMHDITEKKEFHSDDIERIQQYAQNIVDNCKIINGRER